MNSKFKIQNSKSLLCSKNFLSVVPRRLISLRITNHALLITLFTLLTICGSLLTVNAQKRDNLTNEEDLQIREAQELDVRMNVIVQVINRRLLALSTPDAAQTKQIQKDTDKWGALRTGTTTELFHDIHRTLEEAIAKIEDVADREQKNPLFSKAIHILSEGCQGFIPRFRSFIDKTSDQKEKGLISGTIESCTQIIEASGKVPKEKKKKKN
jgi:hypothetical protein